MQECVFGARLGKPALKYGHEGLIRRAKTPSKRAKPTLTDRTLHAPDRGFTQKESLNVLKYVTQTYPGDLIGQANNFFKLVNIPAASGRGSRKGRTVSHATVERYYQTVTLIIQELRDKNIKPNNLSDLSYKHLRIIFKTWD